LVHYSVNNTVNEFVAEVYSNTVQTISSRILDDGIAVNLNGDFGSEAQIAITDMLGKVLYSGTFNSRDGFVFLPFNTSSIGQQVLIVSVQCPNKVISNKLLTK
jgi:hypothetical protein